MQDIVELFRTHKKYDNMSNEELRLFLMPSMNLKQCIKLYDNNELIGFANWAYLHGLVENRFKQTGMIKNNEWKSGNNLWVIEVVSKRNTKKLTDKLVGHLLKSLSVGKSFKWLRVNKDIYRIGEKFKREFHK